MRLQYATVEVHNFSDLVVEHRLDNKLYTFQPGESVAGVLPHIAQHFERLAGYKGITVVAFPEGCTDEEREDIIRERRIFALDRMIDRQVDLVHSAETAVHDHSAKGKTIHPRDNKVKERQKRLQRLTTLRKNTPEPEREVVHAPVDTGAVVASESPSLADVGKGLGPSGADLPHVDLKDLQEFGATG